MKNLLKISNGVNKTIFSAILMVFLGIVLMPNLAVAQVVGGPNDCCRLKHSFDSIAKDTIIIEDPGVQYPGLAGKTYDEVSNTGASVWCDLDKDGKFDVGQYEDDWPMICLIDTIMTITDWIFYILMLLAVVMIVISAVVFMISAGDPNRTGLARKMLIYAVIGLVVGLLAKLIPSVVRFILGM